MPELAHHEARHSDFDTAPSTLETKQLMVQMELDCWGSFLFVPIHAVEANATTNWVSVAQSHNSMLCKLDCKRPQKSGRNVSMCSKIAAGKSIASAFNSSSALSV